MSVASVLKGWVQVIQRAVWVASRAANRPAKVVRFYAYWIFFCVPLLFFPANSHPSHGRRNCSSQ